MELPVPQVMHLIESVVEESEVIMYFPAPQSVQRTSPDNVLYLPPEQATQGLIFNDLPYPAAQTQDV